MSKVELKNNLKVKDLEYITNLTNDIKRGMMSINASLQAVIEPYRTIDYVVESLTKQGDIALVEKALAIVSTIQSDVVDYNAEIANLTPEMQEFLNKPPTRRRHLDNFNSTGLYLGQCLLDLNMRIVQTTMAIAGDYSAILNSIKTEVVENE